MTVSLAADRFSALDLVFVLGLGRHVLDAMPLAILLAAADKMPIKSLARADFPVVPATLCYEDAALLTPRIRTQVLAVADHGKAVFGAPTAEALMANLREEPCQDLNLMVGALASPLLRVTLVSTDLRLSTAMALSLASIGIIPIGIGVLLPWGIQPAGLHPVQGPAPHATAEPRGALCCGPLRLSRTHSALTVVADCPRARQSLSLCPA